VSPEPVAREFTVGVLSRSTWADFERLFSKYRGVQAGCWCMFYRRERPVTAPTEEARQEANRRDREELVRRGGSDGVLVYARGDPVGWCQFARREDLPRLERGRKYRLVPPARPGRPLWRITCFFVDRPYRRRGVAKLALEAALREIERRGGGVVEAFPTTNPGAVALWFGTASMFRREGFRAVAPFGRSHLLVRRTLRAARS
jgi:GNAT superfamily N-acetyltransferase